MGGNNVIFSGGMDFIAGQAEFIFPAGVTRACANITIIDDKISENFNETFSLQINMVGPNNFDARIGDISMATVIILDDDG